MHITTFKVLIESYALLVFEMDIHYGEVPQVLNFFDSVPNLEKIPLSINYSLLLALSIGQRLCIDFFVSRVSCLTTLRSHLDITCCCYFWST